MVYEEEQTDKALTALHTIQDICKTCDCDYCPFGNKKGGCRIGDDTPNYWEIKKGKKRLLGKQKNGGGKQ